MKQKSQEYILKCMELRILRKELRVSMKDLEPLLGISRSAISQYEALRSTLSEETIKRYEEILNEIKEEGVGGHEKNELNRY